MKVTPISLLELNLQIKSAVKEQVNTCWVVGEISELKVNYSGHCYLELIQKDESSDQVVARSRATIWASVFRMIKPYFETTTGQELNPGLKIMVKVSAEFHELYGMSLNITDIEPTYTVGELALRRQKIIEQLRNEGVFEMNKELEFPFLCRKIAVISSATAAGYEDFQVQLLNNPGGYKFYIRLFPAVMQGADAEESIITALEKIYEYEQFFDAVVIIRGGGSKTDLGCFDSYRLAYHVTQFPLPVVTGIGHEQDDSVVDMVAHTRLKTPTAVAAFLIDQMAQLHADLVTLQESIFDRATELVDDNKDLIQSKARDLQLMVSKYTYGEESKLLSLQHKLDINSKNMLFRAHKVIGKTEAKALQITRNVLNQQKTALQYMVNAIKKNSYYNLDTNKTLIESYQRQINQLDPNVLLKKGYSITIFDGKVLTDEAEVEGNDTIETVLYKGKLISKIKKG